MTRAALAHVLAAITAIVATGWLATSGAAGSAIADAAPGVSLAILAVAAVAIPRYRGVSVPAGVAAVLWFAGAIGVLQWAHQGALAWLVLAYPAARLRSGRAIAAVALASAAGLIGAFGPQPALIVMASAAVLGVAALRVGGSPSTARPSAVAALIAAAVLCLAWTSPFALRLLGASGDLALAVYLVGTAYVGLLLLIDMTLGRSRDSALVDVAIDLRGVTDAGSLRDRLARLIGDPDLWLGYRLADGRYADEAGIAVPWQEPARNRVITPVDDDGRRVAVLMHDRAIQVDAALLPQIAAAASLALRNVQLHADVRARVVQIEDSRDRLRDAEDAARRGFAQALRAGPLRRLDRVADLLGRVDGLDDGPVIAAARAEEELRRFARGLHSAALADDDLSSSLDSLASGLPLGVEVRVDIAHLEPEVRRAIWYICAEALTNAAKHAGSAQVTVSVERDSDETVLVTIRDDGRGGASMDAGTGLRGIRERAESVGGQLDVESPLGAGTVVHARLPSSRSRSLVGDSP
ncbi:sensor histidine kinase [Microbacterium sp. B2969]|uniref:histidine kinase n=1 Tax=Microbacterium alkaliflavum TaxID=3248839 RepID=A0ABW7QAT2_9MICO